MGDSRVRCGCAPVRWRCARPESTAARLWSTPIPAMDTFKIHHSSSFLFNFFLNSVQIRFRSQFQRWEFNWTDRLVGVQVGVASPSMGKFCNYW